MESSYPLRPGEPDCRDYLRTGRCKYGESCKYNHPTNVEVGGGVKPTNPGEPLFPVRPNEPPCQYFLKHGSCKFGQACKFNHPSGITHGLEGMQGVSNNALPSGLVFLTTTANNASTFTIDSNGGLRHSGSLGEVASLTTAPTNVQILPQRPNEQNCIYFLRNGRCKYGPTCKFHHPIETATTVHRSRSNSFSGYGQSPRLQPITEQRGAPQKPTHILLPDGQIAVIIDPSSLQQVNEVNIQPTLYMSPNGSLQTLQSLDQSQIGLSPMMTATTASSATASSSFQLESNTNLDMWGNKISTIRTQGNNVVVGPVNNGSGSNLSAYGSDESIPSTSRGQFQQYNQAQANSMQRQPWSIEINENQQNQHQVSVYPSVQETYGYEDQRTRTTSVGNYSEASNQYQSTGSLSLSSQLAYDQRNSSPYRQSQPINRVPAGNGHHRGESADGLTEMTSALLTMMDRHDSSEEVQSQASQSLSTGPGRMISQTSQGSMSNMTYQTRGHYSHSEPIIYTGPTNSPARPRPPPGMTSLQQASQPSMSYQEYHPQQHTQGRPPQGGNYIQPSMSPAWGENAPRF